MVKGGETVQFRCVNGHWANEENCVAFCMYRKHKGYLTVRQLKQKQCLRKQCHMLKKLSDRPYWTDREKRRKEKNEQGRNH